MKKIRAKTSNRKYSIYVQRGLSRQAGRLIGRGLAGAQKALLVTNDRIYPLYETMIKQHLSQSAPEFYTHIIQDGEIYKSLDTARQIYDRLLENNFHRNDVIIAFGGGVIGDMAGYAAATYHRGLNLVQYPTTIIGQVDSSIGGKVAVNYQDIKNIIGTFYQPHLILMDPSLLGSLDQKEIVNGLGEVIKYGIVFDQKILEILENITSQKKGIAAIVDHRLFDQILYRCAKIKAVVVAKDEFDTGYRNLLNFGHTIGHALEKVSRLTHISHGRAISLGMLAALDISRQLGFIDGSLKERVLRLYQKIGLPAVIPELDVQAVVAATGFDKKFTAKKNKFVLLKGLNKPCFYFNLKEGIIINSIKENMD